MKARTVAVRKTDLDELVQRVRILIRDSTVPDEPLWPPGSTGRQVQEVRRVLRRLVLAGAIRP